MREEMSCNGCGRKLKRSNNSDILLEDVFMAEKAWGYFSKKDMTRHRFILCEECYDKLIAGFAVPPDEEEVTEL